jgi:ABC-type dipeptide/oligopeptide/nickel transport system ATPase component
MSDSTPLLTIRGLRVDFETDAGPVPAVRGVDLDIGAGETVALVGESGCGKSVTAMSVMRLISGRVSADALHFRGQELSGLPEAEMRRVRGGQIGMIFQEPMSSLNPVFRIGQQIEEVLTLHQRLSAPAARQEALELLNRVGISSPERRIQQYPHELSGGMKQRVMIAMAIACRPQLLIADEPTTALDVTIQAQIMDLLRSLKQELGMAVLLITHDLGVVAHFAERVAVMYAGKIARRFAGSAAPRKAARGDPGPRAVAANVAGGLRLLRTLQVRIRTLPRKAARFVSGGHRASRGLLSTRMKWLRPVLASRFARDVVRRLRAAHT